MTLERATLHHRRVARSSLLVPYGKTFKTFEKNEPIDLVSLLVMRYIVGPPSVML